MHLEVSFLRHSEELSLDFTPVSDEELLFVHVASLRVSLGHVASELLGFVEDSAAEFALVYCDLWGNLGLFLTLFGLPLVFGNSLGSCLYLLLLIFGRFKNVRIIRTG